MRKSNLIIGYFLLIVSLTMFVIPISGNITGFSVSHSSDLSFGLSMYFFSLVLFLSSLMVLSSRTYLDAIIIPTEASTSRIRSKSQLGAKAYRESRAKLVIATGGKMPYLDPKYKSEAHVVYEELRKAGLKPGEIRVDSSARDNLENLLHSIKKLDGTGAKEIGIVSYPAHLDRFEDLFKKGQEEGIISRDLHLHRIETDQTLTETLWEIPAQILHRYQLRKGLKEFKTEVGLAKKVIYRIAKWMSD